VSDNLEPTGVPAPPPEPGVSPAPAPAPAPADAPHLSAPASGLTDGEWHRLHPATPLLRGGIVLIAILAWVISNLRERLLDLFIGRGDVEGDPIDWVVGNGLVGVALLIIAGALLLFIGGFYLSWRMHTFRITNEVVEVRSGILFRTNRRGRLDRIQGINIVRPFFARLFGAAKLEVNVAGQDANVQLAYLSSTNADNLRLDILRLASGSQRSEAAARDAAAQAAAAPTTTLPAADGGTALTGAPDVQQYPGTPYPGTVPGQPAPGKPLPRLLDTRVSELLAPELDPNFAPPESVVKLHTGRLIGSIFLNDTTVMFVIIIGAAIAWATLADAPFLLFTIFPVVLGAASFIFRRFTKSLRYSIAGTPDGVRVGFGLFTISNETLPPGRIHSVQVSQPILWRGPGWWEIKVNRASKSSTKGADGQQNTTILPVGNLDDVLRVLRLLLPGLVEDSSVQLLRDGLISPGRDGFTNSPRRAWPLRWFSWRRNGFAFGPGVILLRKGAIWRELVVVPEPRVQSLALLQGPIYRRLGLAKIKVHTVAGPITAELGAIDVDAALTLFTDGSRAVIESATADTSHRWRSSERTSDRGSESTGGHTGDHPGDHSGEAVS